MIPDEILETLRQLRLRIQRYVLVEGIAVVLVAACLFFWLTLGADAIHFELRKLELPSWFRRGALLLAACTLVFLVATWILGRYFRGFGQRALALVLERRFPQLDERLITAIDLAAAPQIQRTPVSAVLMQRTVADAVTSLRNLDLGQVFDPRPLRHMLTAAGVLIASVIGFGVINSAGFQRWYSAFIVGREDYWQPYRQSLMEVYVVAQPGDRVRQFDKDLVYKHPKGADLTLVAQSPEGKTVPERATLSYRAFATGGTSRGSVTMTRTGDREFRQSLSRVIENHDLWVSGGDFINPEPYRIQIVELPKIDQLQLVCDYPSYTGMDSLEDQPVPVVGTQASLPMETKFWLEATLNKPIRRAWIRTKAFELNCQADSGADGAATVTFPANAAEGQSGATAVVSKDSWISPDGLKLRVPLHVTATATERLAALRKGEEPPKDAAPYVPLPPDSLLQISFEDLDDVVSLEPIPLTIAGIVDREPVVEVRLSGVGSAVTRTASIPVTGRIVDDYGVRKAEFGTRVDEATEFTPAPVTQPARGEKEFLLKGNEDGRSERFNVLKLELNEGQKLALTVFGEDGDTINGPHRAHGEVYSFTIVSSDELLARLYDKELNLRLRFEQIIEETQRLRDDLEKHRTKADQRQTLRGQTGLDTAARDTLAQLEIDVRACAERMLLLERKNHTECRSIAASFRDIRDEMVNNRVDTSSLLERIDQGILAPFETLTETDYPGLDEHLGVFRLFEERRQDPRPEMDLSLQTLDGMLARMQQILSVMQRRETVNELIKVLQDIYDRQKKINDETQKQQQREAFDKLGL
ncbi:hypothetical protein [Planctomyces sp. SH-PL14]|uniref:hypothetical protein n=1 Tax=Planctomyces sp. SH-PL14 TaxID=1632864 RepID=UPI00078CEBE7|nr:hypothetical protein [Planctomyces sp. SH-PL14]AMV19479.1 hypothetical protein VT03_16415 [Planctomyces sp. SH-PL14]